MPDILEIETRSINQLARAASVAPTDLVGVQPGTGGPMQGAQVQQLIDAINRYAYAANTDRIAAHETVLATTAIAGIIDVKKATRALLYADLAWAADKIALVTSDPDVTKVDLYIKTGASGAGAWSALGLFGGAAQALVQPLATAANASKIAAEAAAATATSAAIVERDKALTLSEKMLRMIPNRARTASAFRLPDGRIRIFTFSVVNGGGGDYDAWDLVDIGPTLRAIDPTVSAEPCWVLDSTRAKVAGRTIPWLEQPESVGKKSVIECAFLIGRMSDAGFFTGNEVPGKWRSYWGGHQHIQTLGGYFYLDGVNVTAALANVGDALAGNQFSSDFGYQPRLADGTTIGTHTCTHVFDVQGERDDHVLNITATTAGGAPLAGFNDCYVAMFMSQYADRIKLGGRVAQTVGAAFGGGPPELPLGAERAAWNASTSHLLQFYRAAEPSLIFEMDLPRPEMLAPFAGQSECKSSRAFVKDDVSVALGIEYGKAYFNGASSTEDPAFRAPIPMLGAYSWITRRRTSIRPGGPS